MRARATVVVAAVCSIVVASCASVPEERPDLPAGKIAVTDEQADDVLEQYDEVVNAANAELDADALEAIETGPLLETSLMGLRMAKARDDESADALYHTDIEAYSPRFDQYPMWFVAMSRINGDPGRVAVQTLARESVAAEWLAEQAVLLDESELPQIRLSDGTAPAVTEDQVDNVASVVEQVSEYLTGEDAPDELALDDEWLDHYRTYTAAPWDIDGVDDDDLSPAKVSCETDERAEMRVLPTTTGVLAVATARCSFERSFDVTAEIALTGEHAGLADGTGQTVEIATSHPLVVSVPDNGQAEVFAGSWRWADGAVSGGKDD